MGDGPIQIPTIRGRIAERLARAPARNNDDDPLSFPESPGDVLLRTSEERGAVALACLLLENLREHGATRVNSRALDQVLRKVLDTFGPKEVMDIEVEAYEILLWIGSAIDPDWTPERTEDPGELDPTASRSDLVRWAIHGGVDLEMHYYSRGRGELTRRRITPISLEAETYLHAYCHLRRDERVFRLSRIGDLHPVGGWPEKPRQKSRKASDEGGGKKQDPPGQMSLLDE
ncbi:WYL domain-containing protein [Lujinxingia vulgaris]|uniref:WYL domain-containing protein n=1 Tax=Lujinxingia vulgaris TaxID=2600176 RepID=A0A5C6X6W0_9DELT|nr:WYL domain-containing protein [Lujinxingia vulgaris]TXD35989.1 WYL domain-containing protein [Lujinxingia vulgaris]